MFYQKCLQLFVELLVGREIDWIFLGTLDEGLIQMSVVWREAWILGEDTGDQQAQTLIGLLKVVELCFRFVEQTMQRDALAVEPRRPVVESTDLLLGRGELFSLLVDHEGPVLEESDRYPPFGGVLVLLLDRRGVHA